MPTEDKRNDDRVRWGDRTALGDDEEARRRLLDATTRCLLTQGTTRLTVNAVAKEASVARATVYRYFASRDELILGVVLSRIDARMGHIVAGLRHRDDAARSIVDLIMRSIGLVEDDEINRVLFSPESQWLVTSLELSSEPVVDAFHRHLGPLLERWQADGQLRADLDLRETTRWMNAIALLLLGPPWAERSGRAKRTFLNQYLVRALVT